MGHKEVRYGWPLRLSVRLKLMEQCVVIVVEDDVEAEAEADVDLGAVGLLRQRMFEEWLVVTSFGYAQRIQVPNAKGSLESVSVGDRGKVVV